MSKEVNIHIKTPGAEEAKRHLNDMSRSTEKVGESTAKGSRQAVAGLDKTEKKLGRLDRTTQKLTGQVKAFVGAWLGLAGAKAVVNWLIQRLERIKQLQGEIYEKSLSMAEIGQALEVQTGTVGQQQQWTKKALEVQKAGGLTDTGTAQQMMVSMDIAFKSQGGIKNPDIMNMAKQLAPFVGTMGLSGDEVTKLFEFAGTAGISPTAAAYKDYFAKLHAGYTSSKATDFGQFMIGLQKGGTAFMGAGGSLESAIGTFSAARSVTPNESLAATTMEQIVRLSSGAYEKPRKSLEKSLGVNWSELSMDQRVTTLLQYAKSIPAGSRTQTLVEQGFEPGLADVIAKMATPEATATFTSTTQKASGADAGDIEPMIESYLGTDLGKHRIGEAERSMIYHKVGPKFASWKNRRKTATSEFETIQGQHKDKWLIPDETEIDFLALDKLISDYDTFIGGLPEGEKKQKAEIDRANLINKREASEGLTGIRGLGLNEMFDGTGRLGLEYSQKLQQQQQQPLTVINNYNNGITYNPRNDSESEKGVRFSQDD